MAEIYDYDVSAANNNSAPPDGFPENMQYSAVNNSAREVMAVIARFIEAIGAVTTAGTANAFTLTLNQAIGAYANGQMFWFKADRANTGAATLNINALGAVSIVGNRGGALVANDLIAGGIYIVQHDGTNFRLINKDLSPAAIKTAYESNSDTNAYTDAEQTKLAGIEAGATADQTGAEIKALYEAEANTNAYTDAEQTKLAGIESGATADQTGAEIKALYEAEANTNAYTDAEQTKLAGIESGATADQTAADIRALSGITTTTAQQGIIELATQAEVDAGTDATRAVTPSTLAAWSGLPSGPTITNGSFTMGMGPSGSNLATGTAYYTIYDYGNRKWCFIRIPNFSFSGSSETQLYLRDIPSAIQPTAGAGSQKAMIAHSVDQGFGEFGTVSITQASSTWRLHTGTTEGDWGSGTGVKGIGSGFQQPICYLIDDS